jgi:bifunctional non-homologous end joining protein LigD
MNLEGIVAKNKSSKYFQATRNKNHSWLKIKNIKTQDCIVIGYTKGEGNRENYFGSIILALYNNNDQLRLVGHTRSGFNYDQLEKIHNKLEKMKVNKCPISYIPHTNRTPIWIKPELVVEVKFSYWTSENIMRSPIFLRFREDKLPEECIIMEGEKLVREIVIQPNISYSSSSFSNLDKVFWNKTSEHQELTKKDLIEYYDKISNHILPHLKETPFIK